MLSAVLGVLYEKKATPQKLLSKLGFSGVRDVNSTLESWESSLSQLAYDADIVFIGASLTMGENFQEYFPDKKIINLGVSGDSVSGIYDRSWIISHFTPEKIFVEGGVNSLVTKSVDEVAKEYEKMVEDIAADNPEAELFIQSVLPVSRYNDNGGLTNGNIVLLNEKLKEIAARHGITYIDLHSAYELSGEINHEYTRDGLHLSDEGKLVWPEVISEYVYTN